MNPSMFNHTSVEQCPFLKPEIFEIGRRNTNQNPKAQELVSIFETKSQENTLPYYPEKIFF
jgi:hypothetical protein